MGFMPIRRFGSGRIEMDKRKTTSTRIAPELRARLDECVAQSGRSLSQEIESRLERSFGAERLNTILEDMVETQRGFITTQQVFIDRQNKVLDAQNERYKTLCKTVDAWEQDDAYGLFSTWPAKRVRPSPDSPTKARAS